MNEGDAREMEMQTTEVQHHAGQPYTGQMEIADLKVIIEADAKHLAEALSTGHQVEAHELVDAIIANTRTLEDLQQLYG